MSELTREQLLMAVISGRGPAYLRGTDLSSLDLSNSGWLTGADLRQANLSHANLSRANLRDSTLEKANLHAVNLAGAILEGVDLHEAKLTVANLRGANLKGANLRAAQMIGTNLVRANLQGADLEGADLEGANLEEADLENAKLNVANLKMANLSKANLKGAQVMGTILDKENGSKHLPIPLRGFCGWLGQVDMTDLLQLICLSRSDLLIRIESSKGIGTIFVCSGKVMHAETGSLKGEEALYTMLHWANGRFETSRLPEELAASIDKPLEHLLIESMRQLDEKQHDLPGGEKGRDENYLNFLEEVKEYLPIPALPTKELMSLIENEGKGFNLFDSELLIREIFDSGGKGAFCSLVANDRVFIAPLSYVRVRRDHPIAEKIATFQRGEEAATRSTAGQAEVDEDSPLVLP